MVGFGEAMSVGDKVGASEGKKVGIEVGLVLMVGFGEPMFVGDGVGLMLVDG